jgi:hypothetical protein
MSIGGIKIIINKMNKARKCKGSLKKIPALLIIGIRSMKQRKKPGHSYNGKDNLSSSPNISNI